MARNHMYREVRWAGRHLFVDQLSMTEMACDQSLMDQDRWFADLLRSGVDTDLDDDTLTLTCHGVQMQLIDRRTADPGRLLENTGWTLDGVMTGAGATGAFASVPQHITATLLITEGRMRFFDGHGDYDGAVTVAANAVDTEQGIASSPRTSEAGRADSIDMSVLTQDFDYQIVANRLTVTDEGGTGLTFVTIGDAAATAPPY